VVIDGRFRELVWAVPVLDADGSAPGERQGRGQAVAVRPARMVRPPCNERREDHWTGAAADVVQAHAALVHTRPKSTASLAAWKAYYERSVALYREIAEIDRGHHHEALYWAEREQRSANEITARICAEKS
jgi:hypothetical protein